MKIQKENQGIEWIVFDYPAHIGTMSQIKYYGRVYAISKNEAIAKIPVVYKSRWQAWDAEPFTEERWEHFKDSGKGKLNKVFDTEIDFTR